MLHVMSHKVARWHNSRPSDQAVWVWLPVAMLSHHS